MNARTDGWESYTDDAGRRHWRWPASAARQPGRGGIAAEADSRKKIGMPAQLQAQRSPVAPTGK